jgi:arginyl-tRNA synthetase
MEEKLVVSVKSIVSERFGAPIEDAQIQLQKTRKEFEGDITLVVFPLTRVSKLSPEETGHRIGEALVAQVAEVEAFNVVKGFLNISFSAAYWSAQLNYMLAQENFGRTAKSPLSRNVMVEYSSPNTNKPLHLGHIRNNLLGYSVAEILKANGHEVQKVQIINDRGIHICKSMVAWQRFGNGETPESSGLKGDKLVGKYYVLFDKHYKAEIAKLMESGATEEQAEKDAPIMLEAREMLQQWEAGDEAITQLWSTMNGWVYKGFDVTYERLGVDFDKLYYESNTYLIGRDMVMDGVKKGVFEQQADGSIWCDLTADGLDRKLLLRSDGTAVYMTQDIGTAILRYQDWPKLDQLIYTVGNEQDYHFKVLFHVLGKLGHQWAKACYHLSYGMVDLPSGKMKSREGTVVDADDLMEEMFQAAKVTKRGERQVGWNVVRRGKQPI